LCAFVIFRQLDEIADFSKISVTVGWVGFWATILFVGRVTGRVKKLDPRQSLVQKCNTSQTTLKFDQSLNQYYSYIILPYIAGETAKLTRGFM